MQAGCPRLICPALPHRDDASHPTAARCLDICCAVLCCAVAPQSATLFGRNDVLSDVVLEHASVSRQHAALCFEGMTGRCGRGPCMEGGFLVTHTWRGQAC